MVTMSPDCILKRDRPAGKGAATPYLAALQGARLAICDEAPDDVQLDEEAVKRVTGQTTIEARFLNANPVCFKPTHLPMLLTNSKPMININDEAVLRRLLVIPFDLRFKTPEEMDQQDPTHRLMDKTLADKLLTCERQEQLLAWLVRGAVAWHRDGLPPAPARVKAAFQEYKDDNDDLQKYLDESCEVGAGFEVKTVQFAEEFNKNTRKYSQKKVSEMMKKKGFSSKQSINFPNRAMAYQGVRARPQTVFVDYDDE